MEKVGRSLPWPRLLLAGLVGATLGSAFLLLTWDPRTRLADLEVTQARVLRYDHRCSRSTAGPAGGPPVCRNVVYFRSDNGREFFFPYADDLRGLRSNRPVELGHSRGGEIWFVRQGASTVASYDEVRELRNQNTRLGRFLGLLGCLAIVVIGGRLGLLRLRAGPPCPSPLCRILDFATLGALAVAAIAVARSELAIALHATGGAFLSLVSGIGWARGRGHIDAEAFEMKLFSGPLAARLRAANERLDRWEKEFNPPKGSISGPWRVIACIRGGCAALGSLTMLGATLSTLTFLVIAGEDDPEGWAVMTRFFLFGAALVVVAGVLGPPLRKTAVSEDRRTWLGWAILLSPPLLLILLAVS